MKQIIFIFVLGFMTHKAINVQYDYAWNAAFESEECLARNSTLSEHFKCTYEVMSYQKYLAYLLLRPFSKNDPRKGRKGHWTL